jgi:uncharacterized protein (TIGR02145 family)
MLTLNQAPQLLSFNIIPKLSEIMKTKYQIIFILAALFSLLFSCDKEEKTFPPGVITASVDEITGTSARVGGKIMDNGGAEITERGVFWGTSENPESSGTKLESGSGNGIYYEVLSGLTPGVKYYVTAYAVNTAGRAYGEETFFTTQISMPGITTLPITELTTTTAKAGGNVTGDGGFEVTERGIFWGTEPDPKLTGTKVLIGSGTGEFTTTLTGLSKAYTYYVIAFAKNIKGTSYGSEISFSTEPGPATVVTSMVLNISPYSATLNGNISTSGGAEVTERGFFWGRSPDPVITGNKIVTGTGTGSFSQTVDTLRPGVKYYVRAFATNITGTSYGEEKNFLTKGKPPKIDTTFCSSVTRKSAIIAIRIDTSDLTTSVIVEYGKTISYGSSSGIILLPKIKADTTILVTVNGLDSLTNYHYRVQAENDLGTVESYDVQFRTVITGKEGFVYDSKLIQYKTIGIGYQVWMAENLRSYAYNDGTLIPLVKNDSVWGTLTSPAHCWFENDSTSNAGTYGALYNWEAVATGKLCPAGWKVPGVSDVAELVNYIGGSGNAGKLLKDTNADYWNAPNVVGTNSYKFTARAGGRRSESGIYDFMKVEGNWWTNDPYSTLNASYFSIMYNYSNLFQAYYNKKMGLSVRCIKE